LLSYSGHLDREERMSTRELHFKVLGALRVEVDGAPAALPRSPVLRNLLGVLLLAGERPVTVERLVDLVWAGHPEQIGRGRVQTGISRLREWLNRHGSTAGAGTAAGAGAVIFDGGGYRLDVPAEATDLGRFRALIELAMSAPDPDRLNLLSSAFTLRRGPAVADLTLLDRSDPFLQSVELYIRDAGVALADAAIAARRPERAVTTLTTLISENPLDETLYAKLIELLAAEGRSAEALQRYDDLRRRLADELGVEPSERVQQVYLSVLERDHPIVSGPVVPAQLPADVADFTGRDEYTATVAEFLTAAADDDLSRPVRIAMIAGMGGIGKTALAVHIAYRLVDKFPDGQLYTDLRGVSSTVADPSQVLGALLLALGVEGAAIPDSLDERSGLYRSMLAGRRILVVLDNAASERQVRPLLPGAPGCAVLITGRAPLIGLETARTVTLDVLEQREGIALLTRIVGARRVMAEPEAAAQIVGLCGQVPLAVRIAGARLAIRPQWRLSRLVSGLEDEQHRLAELTAGDLAVGATLQLSYDRLNPETRRILRLLGLLKTPDFAGWVVSALAAPNGDARDGPDAEAAIESLIDAQLLTITGTDSTGELRYRFHDLVRLYARERSLLEDSPQERAAALRRYFGTYLWLSERAAITVPGPCYSAIHGPAPRLPIPDRSMADRLLRDAMSWFDAERASLPVVVGQACELGMAEFAWDIAGCLEKYFDVRSLNDDWRRMHEQVLELCRSVDDRLGEAVLLRGLIEVTTWRSSEHTGAAMITLYDRAKDLGERFSALGEDRGTADALVMCAWGLMAQGAARGARKTARTALALAEASDHVGGQARAEHVIAIAYGERQLDLAALHLERALTHARRLGNSRFEATVTQFLGVARCRMGDVVTGEDLLRAALGIARDYADHYVEAFSLLYLAKLYATFDNPRARPLAETVLMLSRRYSLRHHLADSLRLLGELDLAAGRPAAAIGRLTESVEVWRTRGWAMFLADTLRVLGQAHRALRDEDSAQRAWQEAAELYRQLGDSAAAAEITKLQVAADSACGAMSDRSARPPQVTAD
jgi:DNA-binding SARP family transcriptional activator